MVQVPSLALAQAQDSTPWTLASMDANFLIEGASNTLPVMALGKSDWPRYYTPSSKMAHAWQSIRFDLNATMASGWQIGYVVRSEASLHANSDTVAMAALIENNKDPANAQKFNIDLQSKAWRGQGFALASPWRALDEAENFRIKGEWQLLSLEHFKTQSAWGSIDYLANNAYDFNAYMSQNNRATTPAFGERPDASGWGTSLSLSMRYDYDLKSHLAFDGKDLLSQLNWHLIHQDTSLNSQQKVTFTDGSIDFTPMVTGKYKAINAKERMDRDMKFRWAFASLNGSEAWHKGQWVVDYRQRSQVNQYWLGWATGDFHSLKRNASSTHYKLSVDPISKAVRAELAYGGLRLLAGGDSFGRDAKQKVFSVGWVQAF